ncbi:MAG TPA: M56 family metallopeptidase [Mucilaginibacter sp.]|nr:M56 family metallopeptidase [Mucilaginibacter sp.]
MHLAVTDTTAQHFIRSFSWMLLHSLWQGMLLAVLTAIVLMLTRKAPAAVRYNLVFALFMLFLATCGATFALEWSKSLQTAVAQGAAGAKAGGAIMLFGLDIKAFADSSIAYFTANAPMIVLLWFLLFVFRSVRMMGGLVFIRRARHRLIYSPPADWKARVDLLCEKLQLNRTVQLLESGYVKMPMVIGHLKPVILVPVGLLAGLPAGQVEAVLLHELAHIRRHDYIVNLVQTIAETVFCFNPGLLWISSLLRDERENCCDDIALAQTKNKKEFIQALISFKEHALYGSKYAVAFPGKKNHLLNRVTRIMSNRNKALAPSEKAFFMMGILLLSGIVITAGIAKAGVIRYAERHKTHIQSPALLVPAPKPGTAAKAYDPKHRPAELQLAKELIIWRAAAAKSEKSADAKSDAINNQEQDKLDQEQAIRDQEQALHDQEQAEKDQQKTKLDEEQGKRDQEQAKKDEQAQQTRNIEQAKRNEEQAARNAEQEMRNKLQAKKNAEQDIRNLEQEQRNNEQAVRNAEQAKRNAEQQLRDQEQMRLNAEQAVRNQEQEKRDKEQAAKNQVSVQQ